MAEDPPAMVAKDPPATVAAEILHVAFEMVVRWGSGERKFCVALARGVCKSAKRVRERRSSENGVKLPLSHSVPLNK